jgi:hypothetical protein
MTPSCWICDLNLSLSRFFKYLKFSIFSPTSKNSITRDFAQLRRQWRPPTAINVASRLRLSIRGYSRVFLRLVLCYRRPRLPSVCLVAVQFCYHNHRHRNHRKTHHPSPASQSPRVHETTISSKQSRGESGDSMWANIYHAYYLFVLLVCLQYFLPTISYIITITYRVRQPTQHHWSSSKPCAVKGLGNDILKQKTDDTPPKNEVLERSRCSCNNSAWFRCTPKFGLNVAILSGGEP